MVLGFEVFELLVFLGVSLFICIAVCTLAMEAAVLFTPAFLFLFPGIFSSFPILSPNEAIGLAFVVEFFGYTSSVSGYWYRRQIDFSVAGKIPLVTIPLGIIARGVSYLVPGDALIFAFGILLIGLAMVLYRYHPEDQRSCLLCGDALLGMNTEEDDAVTDGSGSKYYPQTRLFSSPPERSGSIVFGWRDRAIIGFGGVFAGLVGIAIGEISNTFLCVRKRFPVKLSTGTSALVLHITILSVLVVNWLLLAVNPGFVNAESIVIPWGIGVLLAPVVVVGGQIGSFLNSRCADRTIIRALLAAYTIVGVFVIVQSIFL